MTDMRRLMNIATGEQPKKETITEGSVVENFARWGNDLEEDETLDLDEEGVVDLEEEPMTELDEADLDVMAEDELGDDVVEHVAHLVSQGFTEGHEPHRWTLHVGDEVRGDEFAAKHIADQIRNGLTSGSFPHWTLVLGGAAPVVDEAEIYKYPDGETHHTEYDAPEIGSRVRDKSGREGTLVNHEPSHHGDDFAPDVYVAFDDDQEDGGDQLVQRLTLDDIEPVEGEHWQFCPNCETETPDDTDGDCATCGGQR